MSYDPTVEMQKGIKTVRGIKVSRPLLLYYDPTVEMQKGIKTPFLYGLRLD